MINILADWTSTAQVLFYWSKRISFFTETDIFMGMDSHPRTIYEFKLSALGIHSWIREKFNSIGKVQHFFHLQVRQQSENDHFVKTTEKL